MNAVERGESLMELLRAAQFPLIVACVDAAADSGLPIWLTPDQIDNAGRLFRRDAGRRPFGGINDLPDDHVAHQSPSPG